MKHESGCSFDLRTHIFNYAQSSANFSSYPPLFLLSAVFLKVGWASSSAPWPYAGYCRRQRLLIKMALLLASAFCLRDQWSGKAILPSSYQAIISLRAPIYCLCSLSSNLGIISETLKFQCLTFPTLAEKAHVKIWYFQSPSSGFPCEGICLGLCLFVCHLYFWPLWTLWVCFWRQGLQVTNSQASCSTVH